MEVAQFTATADEQYLAIGLDSAVARPVSEARPFRVVLRLWVALDAVSRDLVTIALLCLLGFFIVLILLSTLILIRCFFVTFLFEGSLSLLL